MGRKKTIICPRCKQKEKIEGRSYCPECASEVGREYYRNKVGGTVVEWFDWQGLGLGRAYGSYKHSCAHKRGHEWEISKGLFLELSQKDCEYCGSPPANKLAAYLDHKESSPYNGLDRADNSKGYTPDNVVTCCKACNLMKRDLSLDEFYAHLRKILAHSGK